ncbi:hypothetical protein MRB53_014702 [Persea americana]|uniref:Uncharacterized protein n=1 Tax=Persea americana TaxID=3435 RepID=A0ACC2KBX0_PERAE|nr:hypothetical protein MRB53_014702 [Persea americana]
MQIKDKLKTITGALQLLQVDLFLQWQVGSIASIIPHQGTDVLYHTARLMGRKTQDFRVAISSLKALEKFDLEGFINNDTDSETTFVSKQAQ